MNDKKILIISGIVFVVILVVVIWLRKLEAATEDFPGFQGRVDAETVTMTAKSPGRIEQIHVNEGQKIRKGELVVEIDYPELEAKKHEAEGAIKSAQAQYDMALAGPTIFDINRAKAALEAAEAEYELAQTSYERMEAMYNDSLIAAQEYDEVKTKYRGAEAQRRAAEEKVKDLKDGVRQEKIKMALGDYERARGAMDQVSSVLEDRRLKATEDMIVESISLRRGELASAGYTIVSGYTLEDLKFRFAIPEHKTDYFENKAIFTMEVSSSEEEIAAEVTNIRQLPPHTTHHTAYPRKEFDEPWFEVVLRPVDKAQAEKLRDGQTVKITQQEL